MQHPVATAEEGVPPDAEPRAEAEPEPEPEPDPQPAPPKPLAWPCDEFPDEALALICRFLGPRELGRLACVARRFTEPTLTEPRTASGLGGGDGGRARLSPIEEGARLQLAAAAGAGGAARKGEQPTWLRALAGRLVFTLNGFRIELSENGARFTANLSLPPPPHPPPLPSVF